MTQDGSASVSTPTPGQTGKSGTGTVSSPQAPSGTATSSQTASKSRRFANGIKKTGQAIAGTKTGSVSRKEQAVVGAAHMVAGVMGMQGATQRGVDNIERRKNGGAPAGNNPTKGDTGKAGTNGRNGNLGRNEASINADLAREADQRYQETRDARRKQATPKNPAVKPSGNTPKSNPVKPVTGNSKAKGKTKTKTTQSKSFFETIRRD